MCGWNTVLNDQLHALLQVDVGVVRAGIESRVDLLDEKCVKTKKKNQKYALTRPTLSTKKLKPRMSSLVAIAFRYLAAELAILPA